MAEDEVIDAESSTRSKQANPVDHLRHLLNVGWLPTQPLIQNFVDKYSLHDDLREILATRNG